MQAISTRVIGAFYISTVGRNIPHPQALRPFLPEVDAFAQHNHFNVLHPILRSIQLESLVDVSSYVSCAA